MKLIMAITALLLIGVPSEGFAQKRMDLEDLEIKGELHNDDRLRLLAREKNKLNNFVKFRTDYRSEIVQGLKKPRPKIIYYPMGEYQ